MLSNISKLIIIGSCVVLVVGCSRNTSHIITPGGSVDVTKDANGQSDVKVTTKDGTAEYSAKKTVDLATLGVPIYPGAKEKEGGSLSYSGQSNGKSSAMQSVALITSDPFDKVSDFYKDQYKDKINDKKATTMEMGSGDKAMTHIMMNENNTSTTIVISVFEGKTQIQIIISKETPQ
jgi:hypothetical protein